MQKTLLKNTRYLSRPAWSLCVRRFGTRPARLGVIAEQRCEQSTSVPSLTEEHHLAEHVEDAGELQSVQHNQDEDE